VRRAPPSPGPVRPHAEEPGGPPNRRHDHVGSGRAERDRDRARSRLATPGTVPLRRQVLAQVVRADSARSRAQARRGGVRSAEQAATGARQNRCLAVAVVVVGRRPRAPLAQRPSRGDPLQPVREAETPRRRATYPGALERRELCRAPLPGTRTAQGGDRRAEAPSVRPSDGYSGRGRQRRAWSRRGRHRYRESARVPRGRCTKLPPPAGGRRGRP
jgi:hypothetical protein